VAELDAPTLSFLNFIHCRLPILHSPITLSPAATLEFDFLRQIRCVDLGTPDPHTTPIHAKHTVARVRVCVSLHRATCFC
jgi:hypothetical protein